VQNRIPPAGRPIYAVLGNVIIRRAAGLTLFLKVIENANGA